MKNNLKSYLFIINIKLICMINKCLSLTVLFFIFSFSVFAGMPNGPYLVFADLSKNSDQKISSIIKSYMDSDRQDMFCEEISRNPIIFLKSRPEGLNNNILYSAIIKKEKTSINFIQKILSQYKMLPNIYDGLDGVIVYDESDGPAMLSIGLRSKKIRRYPVSHSDNTESVVNAFCTVIPPILRN